MSNIAADGAAFLTCGSAINFMPQEEGTFCSRLSAITAFSVVIAPIVILSPTTDTPLSSDILLMSTDALHRETEISSLV